MEVSKCSRAGLLAAVYAVRPQPGAALDRPYSQFLQMVCTGADCLTGQLIPATVQGTMEGLGPPLPYYARLVFSANLLTYSLTLILNFHY
jgi:hypothetical protein